MGLSDDLVRSIVPVSSTASPPEGSAHTAHVGSGTCGVNNLCKTGGPCASSAPVTATDVSNTGLLVTLNFVLSV